jgi:hypothetical protein
MEECSELGYLNLLRWGIADANCPLTSRCSLRACQGGQIEVARWFLESNGTWDKNALSKAAARGHKGIFVSPSLTTKI